LVSRLSLTTPGPEGEVLGLAHRSHAAARRPYHLFAACLLRLQVTLSYGRGGGVGRGLADGADLGVGVGRGVAVGVVVAEAVGVGVGVVPVAGP
jgi:hypothetical protein